MENLFGVQPFSLSKVNEVVHGTPFEVCKYSIALFSHQLESKVSLDHQNADFFSNAKIHAGCYGQTKNLISEL